MEVYPLSHASLVEAATRDDDVDLILVMGESRAGKTKLVNLLSRSNFPTGKAGRSCTNHIQLSRVFEFEDQKLMFIDTPGLESCTRGESEILNEVACLLADIHRKGKSVRGMIYVQALNRTCMSATAMRNFTLCASLVGEEAFKHIVIASTIVDRMGEGIRKKLETRLIGPGWGLSAFIAKGVTFTSHCNLESGRVILTHILDNDPICFQVQAEMVDGCKPFHETTVGKLLIYGTDMELLYSHEREIKHLHGENAKLRADLSSHHLGWGWPFLHNPIAGAHSHTHGSCSSTACSTPNKFLNYPYPTSSSSVTVCSTHTECLCYSTPMCTHGPRSRCYHCISNRCPTHVPTWVPMHLPSHRCERPSYGQCNSGPSWHSRAHHFQPTFPHHNLHSHHGHSSGCSCCSWTYDHEPAHVVEMDEFCSP